MSTEKLRVGIVGAGLFAVHFHILALRTTGRAEVVAISRRDPGKLEAIRKALGIPGAYTDWRQMLDRERLDAVVVATPDDLHLEPTLVSLERGLHALLEKPMALAYRDAQTITDAAARARGVLMVGYSMRFGGAMRTVKQAIADGFLGTVRQVNAAYNGYRRWKWTGGGLRGDPAGRGGEPGARRGVQTGSGAHGGRVPLGG